MINISLQDSEVTKNVLKLSHLKMFQLAFYKLCDHMQLYAHLSARLACLVFC